MKNFKFQNSELKLGFTLVELAIVLVIVGLLIGGVLQGQELINQTKINSQISQITKLRTANNAFLSKYGNLPGDLVASKASSFGFTVTGCNGTQGNRDGDKLISSYPYGWIYGENSLYFDDLSKAKLIEGSYASPNGCNAVSSNISAKSSINSIFAEAAIGNSNNIYVWSTSSYVSGFLNYFSENWFGISSISLIETNRRITSAPGITPEEAFGIDSKIDDGKPLAGNIIAAYQAWDPFWAPNSNSGAYSPLYIEITNPVLSGAISKASTACFDNNSSTANPIEYTLTNTAKNCAISIKF